MKIFVGQIYIIPGVVFPFSFRFQSWLGNALSERVEASEKFSKSFGAGFDLGLRISAKNDSDVPEIKGPTVFKRDKSVEFSIFLPHRPNNYYDRTVASLPLEQMLQSAVLILERLGLDATNVRNDIQHLRTEFLSTPGLLDPPDSPLSVLG